MGYHYCLQHFMLPVQVPDPDSMFSPKDPIINIHVCLNVSICHYSRVMGADLRVLTAW